MATIFIFFIFLSILTHFSFVSLHSLAIFGGFPSAVGPAAEASFEVSSPSERLETSASETASSSTEGFAGESRERFSPLELRGQLGPTQI